LNPDKGQQNLKDKMKIIKTKKDEIVVSVSAYDFSCLIKSLLEVCYGISITDFKNKIGGDKSEIESFYSNLREKYKGELFPKETWKDLRGKISIEEYERKEKSFRRSKFFEVSFSMEQLNILKNSLKAIILDLGEPIGEFETRVDVDLEDGRRLLKTMEEICSTFKK
jgi:hypothetical protein